jgi:outer membrane immunogenic protein
MKKLVLALISVAAFSGTASAADMAVKAPAYKALPRVAIYDWSGLYIGANGGGGSAHSCWSILGASNAAATVVFNPPQAEGCSAATGGTLGGQLGYRWQVTNWVFGLEAQGNWASFRGSNLNPAPAGPPGGVNDVTKIDAFGLFTGQIGYAFNNVLIYAKGGAAVVHDKYSTTLTAIGVAATGTPGAFVGQTFNSGSETRWGGAVGAGIEFGFAPHWSVALEYDHAFMGTNNVTLNVVPPFPTAAFLNANQRISQDIDIGTVRVNYTFGGPAVAKY